MLLVEKQYLRFVAKGIFACEICDGFVDGECLSTELTIKFSHRGFVGCKPSTTSPNGPVMDITTIATSCPILR